ncbi:hypothetical protein N9H93_05130 [Rhizobiaceae bacterium]|nr:hypothetical protein [Rhizobiaceae bacterium]
MPELLPEKWSIEGYNFNYLSLPRMLDRVLRNSSGYDPVGWLRAPMDFQNSTGVLILTLAAFAKLKRPLLSVSISSSND